MFSMTLGRNITAAEIQRYIDAAERLEKQFSVAELTDKKDIKLMAKKAQKAWAKVVGDGGFVNHDSQGLIFEFDNMRLNRRRK